MRIRSIHESVSTFSVSSSPGFLALLVGCATLLSAVGFGAEEAKVRHILVRKRATAEAAFAEIVNAGISRENFVKAARKYSMDAVTKGAGGDLGWNTRAKFVPEFADAAFELEAGAISEPVRTQYGWHVIYVEERRESGPGLRKNTTKPDVPKVELAPTVPKRIPSPTALVPKEPGPVAVKLPEAPKPSPPVTPPATPETSGTTPEVEKPARPKAEPRILLAQKRLVVAVESKGLKVIPSGAIELSISLENQGRSDLRVFHPSLLPLGLKVRTDSAPALVPLDRSAVPTPTSFLVDLKSRNTIGQLVLLHDYFKDYPANARLWISWDPKEFLSNFDLRFAGEKEKIADFDTVRQTYEAGRAGFFVEHRGLEKTLNRPSLLASRVKEIPVAVFEPIRRTEKYFAKIEINGEASPLWFELASEKQLAGVSHFADLALQSFYDGLRFFDVQPGNYLRSGCPKDNGTGGPRRRYRRLNNSSKLTHEKGTLSLATIRSSRGTGREAGSIFFISLGNHPEWDDKHIPIGKLVRGDTTLDRAAKRSYLTIKTVSIVKGEDAPSGLRPSATPTDVVGSEDTSEGPEILTGTALPKVVLQTSKGEITAELFEDDAKNTVANFVQLIESGFFAKEGKPTTILQKAAGYFVRTGSPDNTDTGRPDYRIASEVTNNTRGHVAGTLTMCLEIGDDGKPVPNTAGSQFMILLDDIPFYNGLYTPFGKIIKGMDVLAKLEERDSITDIRILSKRQGQYDPRTLPLN